mgnify:CR=1 FL=1
MGAHRGLATPSPAVSATRCVAADLRERGSGAAGCDAGRERGVQTSHTELKVEGDVCDRGGASRATPTPLDDLDPVAVRVQRKRDAAHAALARPLLEADAAALQGGAEGIEVVD